MLPPVLNISSPLALKRPRHGLITCHVLAILFVDDRQGWLHIRHSAMHVGLASTSPLDSYFLFERLPDHLEQAS